MAAIGSSPNANGATLTGSVLNLEPASASFGGVVTTAAQTFAGEKTFSKKSATNLVASINIGDAIQYPTGASRAKLTIGNISDVSEFLIGQAAGNALYIGWQYNATAASAYGLIETYSNSNNIVFQSGAGKIGLGTSTIGSKLQVNGNAAIGYSASTAAPTNGLAVNGFVYINKTTGIGGTRILDFAGNSYSSGTGAGYFFEDRSNSANYNGWYATSGIVRLYNGTSDILSITSSTGATTFSGAIAIGNTVTAAVAVASTNKVQISINGTTYYLLATT